MQDANQERSEGGLSEQIMGNGVQIDAYLQSMEALAHFTGAVLVQQSGRTLLCKGYGNATDRAINSASTVFQIASLTKQFTAAAIMKLHEDKRIILENSINDYLPPSCRCRRWDQVEVRYLLSHRSGIPDYTEWDDYWKICKHLTPDKVIEDIKEENLEFPPGSDYCYSNTGYDLLGKIIEEASSLPYGDFIKQKLLKPAGMDFSGVREPHSAPIPNAAAGYYVEDFKLVPDPRNEFSVLFSDGSIYSTVGDLAKWSAVLDGRDQVLKPESIKLMISQQYGLMVDHAFGSKRIHHNGSMAGFRADFCKFPEEGITIIILGNNADFVAEYLSSRISAFLLKGQPLAAAASFPKDFDFSPFLTTFYYDEDEDEEGDAEDDGDDEEDDEEEDYTFELYRNRLILQGDDPAECCLLTNGRLFNPCEGEEYQLRHDGALIVYNSDGEKVGPFYSD